MIKSAKNVYLVGIGGIGMSALAQYYHERGARVGGYDRTPSDITDRLQALGIHVHFEENPDAVPRDTELVIYTPAIPPEHRELKFYMDQGYTVRKRSEVLQEITRDAFTIAVAGSHGKTTVTAMIAHLLKDTGYDCTAFIGGMTINYDSNFLPGNNNTIVVEADEFDRSFLRLTPRIAVVTAVDSDHLDIYGSMEEVEAGFVQFCQNVRPDGRLLIKHGLRIAEGAGTPLSSTYALDDEAAGCFARNMRINTTASHFDWCSAGEIIEDIELHYLGQHNVENAIAAIRVARWLGIEPGPIRQGIGSFKGLKRRFEYIIKRDDLVFIDDYAHHPREITALLSAVRTLYPTQRITVVFQPHLYSRTRDLAREFAASLDAADEVILLDIYPARERPIEGISSLTILDEMHLAGKSLMDKSTLLDRLTTRPVEVLLTVGAGDIDRLVEPVKTLLTQ